MPISLERFTDQHLAVHVDNLTAEIQRLKDERDEFVREQERRGAHNCLDHLVLESFESNSWVSGPFNETWYKCRFPGCPGRYDQSEVDAMWQKEEQCNRS